MVKPPIGQINFGSQLPHSLPRSSVKLVTRDLAALTDETKAPEEIFSPSGNLTSRFLDGGSL